MPTAHQAPAADRGVRAARQQRRNCRAVTAGRWSDLAVEAVPGVAEAWHDVPALIEPVVEPACHDRYRDRAIVAERGLDPLDALGRGEQTDRRHRRRAASGEHL